MSWDFFHWSLNIFQYADDTVLVLPHDKYHDPISSFQNNINMLTRWFAANFISENFAKTKLMSLRNPQNRVVLVPNIFFHSTECINSNCTSLPYGSSVKYLGVYVDEHMLWNEHVEFITKKLRVMSAYLYRLKKCLYLQDKTHSVQGFSGIYTALPHYTLWSLFAIREHCFAKRFVSHFFRAELRGDEIFQIIRKRRPCICRLIPHACRLHTG